MPNNSFTVNENTLPEVFGAGVQMWVLAPEKEPSKYLLCTPDHPGEIDTVAIVKARGYLPKDCFFRICMVHVMASSETVENEGEPFEAWKFPNGAYVVVTEEIMASQPLEAIKELRKRTGGPIMQCKAALTETDGSIEDAIELMLKKGQIGGTA